MRCSICLEEMDHPATSTFSCPRKKEKWHTRVYRKDLSRLRELCYQLEGQPVDRHGVEAQAQKLVDSLLEQRGELRVCEYPDCYQVFKPSTYGKDYYCVDHIERGLAT